MNKKPDIKPGSVSRELRPGKTVCIGGRSYKASKVTVIKDENGKEKKEISASSTCLVPQSVIEKHGLRDGLFIGSDKPAHEKQK